MTVLFCDIVDSTGLTERLGSEGMHDLLGRFFEVGRSEVERYGGTVNKYLGDGFMSLVGVPTAYEDHAQRAVLTALAIHERLRHGRDEAGEPEFRVRMGLSTGRALVGGVGEGRSLDYTAVGDTMNVAARLQARAEPGTIVVSEATARMVAGYIRLEPLGPVEVRGRSSPVTAFRVTGFATPALARRTRRIRRRSPPSSGRSRHLASLGDLFEQASAGEGQAVGIVGEPGIGKTRLVTEFRRSLRDSRGDAPRGAVPLLRRRHPLPPAARPRVRELRHRRRRRARRDGDEGARRPRGGGARSTGRRPAAAPAAGRGVGNRDAGPGLGPGRQDPHLRDASADERAPARGGAPSCS